LCNGLKVAFVGTTTATEHVHPWQMFAESHVLVRQFIGITCHGQSRQQSCLMKTLISSELADAHSRLFPCSSQPAIDRLAVHRAWQPQQNAIAFLWSSCIIQRASLLIKTSDFVVAKRPKLRKLMHFPRVNFSEYEHQLGAEQKTPQVMQQAYIGASHRAVIVLEGWDAAGTARLDVVDFRQRRSL
jgi:hypothetical protein